MALYFVSKVTASKEVACSASVTTNFFYGKAHPLLGTLIEAKDIKDILGPWFREYIYDVHGEMNVKPIECKYGSQICVKLRGS